MPDDAEGLSTVVMASGFEQKAFDNTVVAYRRMSSSFTPQDFLNLKTFVVTNGDKMSIQELLAFIKLSNWDAKVLLDIANPLIRKFASASARLRNELKANLARMEINHFFLPNSENPIFELARLYYCYRNYGESVRCYQKSMRLYGKTIEALFNVALAYYYDKQLENALQCHLDLLKLDPKDQEAKDWADKIRKELDNPNR